MSAMEPEIRGSWNQHEMRLLRQAARAASAASLGQDVVVLHINHCMDNSFYFNDVLKTLFPQVVFVAPPYNNQGVPQGYPGPCYQSSQN